MSRRLGTIYIAVLAIGLLLASGCASRHDGPDPTVAALAAVQKAVESGNANAAGSAPAGQPSAEETGPDAAVTTPTPSAAADVPATPSSSASAGSPARSAAAGASAARSTPAASRRQTGTAEPGAGPSAASAPAPRSGGGGTSAPAAPGGGAASPTAPPPSGDMIKVDGANSQGVSDTEIKVGILAPLSGYSGFLGELEVDSIKAYLSDVNAKGGVGGRKYRIVSADTRFEPAVAAVAARRLVEEEKVFALYDFLGNSIGPYATAKGIPTFVFGVVPHSFTGKWPNVYAAGINNVDAILHQAWLTTQVEKKPIKSVAILFENSNMPWGDFVEYAKRAWEQFGVEVKSIDRFNLSDGDCSQIVIKLRNLNIDYWSVGQTLGWPLCGQAMARQGWFPPQGFGGAYTDDAAYVNQMGEAGDGMYALSQSPQIYVKDAAGNPNKGTPYKPDGGVAPEVDRYLATMQKYSPRSFTPAAIESIWAQNFWSLAKLLDDAIKKQAGAITWKGVNQWVQSQDNYESGLVTPQSFVPGCKIGSKGLYLYHYKWNSQAGTLEEQDWKPLGGYQAIPTAVKDKVVPGAGDCWLSAMADEQVR